MTANRPTERPAPQRRLRILVADDNRDEVLTLSLLLQQEGHDVIEAYRGDAVLTMVRRYQPDAVLLDIGMPGMTGFEIARELRDYLRHACPLLIAITAWAQGSAKELGKTAGFNHYLVKPYTAEELLALLEPLRVSGKPL